MQFTSSIVPVISLPRMSAAETTAMILALKTAYDAQKAAQAPSEERAAPTRAERRHPRKPPVTANVSIGQGVSGCMTRLCVAGNALSGACAAGLDADESEAADRANRAERRAHANQYKRAWSALVAQLGVWRETGSLMSLPAASRASFERVLPADLKVNLLGRARALWTAGDHRLARMSAEGVDESVAALGGADVLSHLRRAHQQLGASLGVSKPVAAPRTPAREVFASLVAAQTVMREYVLKVFAMIDPEVQGSDAAAAALLAPLLDAARAGVSKPARPAKKPAAPAQTPVAHAPANDTAPAARPTGTG